MDMAANQSESDLIKPNQGIFGLLSAICYLLFAICYGSRVAGCRVKASPTKSHSVQVSRTKSNQIKPLTRGPTARNGALARENAVFAVLYRFVRFALPIIYKEWLTSEHLYANDCAIYLL